MAEDRDAGAPATDPADRGSLTVRERAVQHTALAAVRGVPGVAADDGTLRRLTGRTLPDVDVDVAGDHAVVRVDVAARWGAVLHRVVDDVRDAVTEALHGHAGLSVDRVGVHIASVTTGPAATDRRVS